MCISVCVDVNKQTQAYTFTNIYMHKLYLCLHIK